MAQHFLLSAKARTLSLRSIFAGGEEKAYATFRQLRWPETDGEAVCPHCGCLDSYEISTRRKFKCVACHRQYSVTSGTIFASRKMSFTDLLAAICIVMNAAKGISALQLSRDLDCQAKTAFVLAHKIREALAAETAEANLSGDVEVDGAYFGGHVRPENRKEDRKDRRLSENRDADRRVVIVVRERKGRTLTFVRKSEAEGVPIVSERVGRLSRVFADEGSHWDRLHAGFDTYRINHSEAYSIDGISTNQAESYFSRLRRMVRGQHHFVSPKYLSAYAAHAAWLEDHRRLDNGAATHRALGLALAHPVSSTWKGYWQRAQ
ncbi:IS1595 family transposase [Bauldia litoralis]|uniref:IS1595 family transposase n=1 Tax=Bauldia litoralis TaxID=665467 RepID=UPI003263F07D